MKKRLNTVQMMEMCLNKSAAQRVTADPLTPTTTALAS